MKKQDILQLVLNKVTSIQNNIELDYSRGQISSGEKHAAIRYVDQMKYEIQKTLASISVD